MSQFKALARRGLFKIWDINLHIYKQKFGCEDLHTIKNVFWKDFCVFSFHLKSGYHHVDIFSDHWKYFAFSWEFGEGQTRYYLFTVLPFGLSSAPFIFNKLLTLETHWMSQGIATARFFISGGQDK